MKHIPNLVSALRLALAPYLFILLWERRYGPALAVCFLAGLTDGLDGLLARRFQASSRTGAYLDPIADKVLLSGAFFTLALDGAIDPWLAVLVFGRDALILIMTGSAFLFTSIRKFPPSIWGKASTAAQLAFIVAVLAHFAGFVGTFPVITLKWLVAALACWSGIDYVWRGMGMVRRQEPAAIMKM